MHIVPFKELADADLVVEAIYEGGKGQHIQNDPISKLIPGVKNNGGFRSAGKGKDKKFVVLYTSGEDKNWPDWFDANTGQFVYYGDNKKPGREIHGSGLVGNHILRRVFELLHSPEKNNRIKIPPFFVFKKSPTLNSARSIKFIGLAAPGFPGLTETKDLIAVWKSTKGQRFQNYEAVFTILNAPSIRRDWLNDMYSGSSLINNAPKVWSDWVRTGNYKALTTKSVTSIREKEEQIPDSEEKIRILRTVWDYFKDKSPHAFEPFAAHIYKMYRSPHVTIDEVTRPTADGGRDAIGRYKLGINEDPVYAEFSLEAKCYRPPIDGQKPTTVGVKDVARLISRIRYRQFGVLVTTSIVAPQAYKEVREKDRHPIIFLCGKDIADILVDKGFNTPELVRDMLTSRFNI